MPVQLIDPETTTREESLGIHQYQSMPVFPSILYEGDTLDETERDQWQPLEGENWDRYIAKSYYLYKATIWNQQPNGSANFAKTFGTVVIWTVGEPQPFVPQDAPNPGGYYYINSPQGGLVATAEFFRDIEVQTATLQVNKPNYRSLVSGYSLDSRSIPSLPIITPTETKKIRISYYRWNRLEPIPDLESICWMVYDCNLVKGEPYYLPIEDCVLGTLYCSDASVLNLITSLPDKSGSYKWGDLTPPSIPDLFVGWNSLYDATNDNPEDAYIFDESRVLRKIAATNNVWNNATLGSDINPDPAHPMFIIDEGRSYNWHYKPVEEGIGDLIMDSPRLIAIEAVLDALNLALDPKTGLLRVANLAHLIQMIASLLGYRPEPDGTFKPETEKAMVRQIIGKNQSVDPTKVGVNNFGMLGMLMRRLNNSFRGTKIVADECVVVRDIPQLLAEYQDQLNLALGLQESSAIEIQNKGSTARYPNQLALLTELLNLTTANHDMIRSALVSGLVAQAQTSEIIAALGLPTVTKTLPIQTGNKIDHLPYQGVSPHRSISQEIATCTNNVGIVLGQVI